MAVDIRGIQTRPEFWLENEDGGFDKVNKSDLDSGKSHSDNLSL